MALALRPLVHTALAAMAALGWAPAARALPSDGDRIESNDYSLDLFQGPVLSATRVIGLGGAFVAIADGVEGSALNPAAAAARLPWSFDHFDYDLGLGITFPSSISNTDFWNSGRPTQLPRSKSFDFLFLDLALNLQFGQWGFGLASDFQRYSLTRGGVVSPAEEKDELAAQIAVGHLQVAYGFAEGQLLVGVGARTSGLTVSKENSSGIGSGELFSTAGTGLEAGVIWRPTGLQIRVGGAFRSAVTTVASPDSELHVLYEDDAANRLYLPDRVTLPWDVNLGFAIQLGPRPLNPRWIDPSTVLLPLRRYFDYRAHERDRRRRQAEVRGNGSGAERGQRWRELERALRAEEEGDEQALERAESELDQRLRQRYRTLSRFHLLVTSSIMLSGQATDAVGIESMLQRIVQRSGERLSVSPHVGLETEVIPHWLKLRGGSYLEPTRFLSNAHGARLHATFGFEQKLFPWDFFGTFPDGTEWRVSGSVDASRSYLGWGVGIGVWH